MATSHLALVAVVAGTALLGTAAAGIGGVGQELKAAAPAPQVRSVDLPADARAWDCPRPPRPLRADEL